MLDMKLPTLQQRSVCSSSDGSFEMLNHEEEHDEDEDSECSAPPLELRSVSTSSSEGSYGSASTGSSYRASLGSTKEPEDCGSSNEDDDLDWEHLADVCGASAPFPIEAKSLEGEGSAHATMELSANNVELGSITWSTYTYLADSGASSHMGPGDEGMFDLEKRKSTIKVGNGKIL